MKLSSLFYKRIISSTSPPELAGDLALCSDQSPMGGKTATLLSSHVNDIFIGESSVFLPSREEIHAHLHSKLKEGFVSVAAFQPWTFSFSLVFGELSFLASKAKRVEKETRYGGDPCTTAPKT